jgi:hypothetical protein
LTHLNDPKLMAAYFTDFATLMKRLGPNSSDGVRGFGGTVVVHVEPDLSGYAEQAALNPGGCYHYCRGVGNDPALVEAAVARTGLRAVASYPDTYGGFNSALLHLRDQYAPNVLLAFHMSPWATGKDISRSSDPDLDAAAAGAEAGAFAADSGVARASSRTSIYDLVFTDVADRDAQVSGAWWDPTNRKFPNFARWEMYVSSGSAIFKKPVVAWQVPFGNEWFRTENGSYDHTRDNRIEYLFSHPDELVRSGIVAVIYGRGQGGSTTNSDSAGDGVTNPPPVCSSEQTIRSCSTHMSIWPDDDGGYLRIHAAAYYAHPTLLVMARD